MERDGLVVVADDRTLQLTDDGRQKAIDVMRKHRLAERLLSDVIGLDWAFVHEEACRWEHVMSEQVERRLVELLNHPTESPYGNPIPGLDQLGDHESAVFAKGVVGLVRLMHESEQPVRGTVRRLAEPAQVDPELLTQLKDAGVVPGATGDFRFNEGYVLAQIDGAEQSLELPVEIASHIFLVDERDAG
jgi:DtxR family Mn-dependent transcriptional regulator